MIEFNSKIKNIIFDFGGVFFEIDYNLPIEAFKKLGFASFDQLYTQSNQNEMFDRLETGKISNQEFLDYLHSFVPHADFDQVLHAWNCILLHIWPDQAEVARMMKESGYRTFLLSNTNAIHVEVFERMIDDRMPLEKFKSYFEKVYYSNAIGIKKPYPSTYLTICEWNNLVPEETLFIDDSIQHVKGAEQAGLAAYHLKPGQLLSEVLQPYLSRG